MNNKILYFDNHILLKNVNEFNIYISNEVATINISLENSYKQVWKIDYEKKNLMYFFITLVLVVVFFCFSKFYFGNKLFKNEAFKQKYLYLQKKKSYFISRRLYFKNRARRYKRYKIDDDLFEIIAKRYGDENSKLFFFECPK